MWDEGDEGEVQMDGVIVYVCIYDNFGFGNLIL